MSLTIKSEHINAAILVDSTACHIYIYMQLDKLSGKVINVPRINKSIDGFHSTFLLWQLEGKGPCDVNIDQSAYSMVM